MPIWHCCSAVVHSYSLSQPIFSIPSPSLCHHFLCHPFVLLSFFTVFPFIRPNQRTLLISLSPLKSPLQQPFPQCTNLFPSHTHTHTYPFKFSLCKCCALQSSLLPRVQQSSHQADYALSFNLSALFVPLDHTASTRINPLFVQDSLIYSDQNCTLHQKTLQGMNENTPKCDLFGLL